jgi:hypothetical protein
MGGMDWIDLAQDGDKCQALVNAVMNLGFYKIQVTSSLAKGLLAS